MNDDDVLEGEFTDLAPRHLPAIDSGEPIDVLVMSEETGNFAPGYSKFGGRLARFFLVMWKDGGYFKVPARIEMWREPTTGDTLLRIHDSDVANAEPWKP